MVIEVALDLTLRLNHETEAGPVAEQLKGSGIRYMTATQSMTKFIATWTLLGSVVSVFAIGYVVQRRAKKQTSPVQPPAGTET